MSGKYLATDFSLRLWACLVALSALLPFMRLSKSCKLKLPDPSVSTALSLRTLDMLDSNGAVLCDSVSLLGCRHIDVSNDMKV